jgi:hypothetical protein
MSKLAWMLDQLGVGLSEEEMYGVQLQLKKLGEMPQYKLKHVRFFGKVHGIYQNYYIFEGTPEEPAAVVPETTEGDSLTLPSRGTVAKCGFASFIR